MLANDRLYAANGSRGGLRQRWYREGIYGDATMASAMSRGARTNPATELVIYADSEFQRTTLRELHRLSCRLAGALYRSGLRSGDVIAIQVPNRLEGMLVYQAALLLGAVVLPIVHIYGPTETGYILNESKAKVFVVPDRWQKIDYLDRLKGLPDLPDLSQIIVIGDDAPDGALTWNRLIDRETDDFPECDAHPDDVALMVFTSGTTSNPKGVLHSHNTLLSEVQTLALSMQIGADSVLMSPWPSGHIAGVLNLMNLYIHGSRSVLMDQWNAEAATRIISEQRVTTTSGSPFVLYGFLDTVDALKCDISSLQSYMVGGANVPPSLVKRCENYGFAAFRSYGSSEHHTMTSGSPGEPVDIRALSDGLPTLGNHVRILDDDGRDVPVGVSGEIITIGPEQLLGYHQPDLNKDAFTDDGWFRTGDVGFLDGDGRLTLTDRKKDIIIRGGENISSKEVEDILARHPAISEAAVVGMPDERLGERVCAFLILKGDRRFSVDDALELFKKAGVARQKTPEKLVIVDELPRTPSGKVKKFELKRQL